MLCLCVSKCSLAQGVRVLAPLELDAAQRHPRWREARQIARLEDAVLEPRTVPAALLQLEVPKRTVGEHLITEVGISEIEADEHVVVERLTVPKVLGRRDHEPIIRMLAT